MAKDKLRESNRDFRARLLSREGFKALRAFLLDNEQKIAIAVDDLTGLRALFNEIYEREPEKIPAADFRETMVIDTCQKCGKPREKGRHYITTHLVGETFKLDGLHLCKEHSDELGKVIWDAVNEYLFHIKPKKEEEKRDD